jgi:hypothetical protein
MKRASFTAVCAILTGFAAVGCDSPSESNRTPPPVFVTAVDSLVPGAAATIRGRNMKQLRQLTIDGQSAAFVVVSDEEARIDVPQLRPCELDGRRVDLLINGAFATAATVRPLDVTRLDIGETRSFTSSQLSCVILPQAADDYVMAAASHATTPGSETVLQLRILGAQSYPATTSSMAAASAQAARAGVLRRHPAHVIAVPTVMVPAWAGFSFDDYAGATVGSVLRFVDWSHPAAHTAEHAAQLPTYEAIVLAINATQLVVVDSRVSNATALNGSAVRQRMQAAADIADRVMLDALRDVVRPDLQLPAGAGGRMVTTLVAMPGASGSVRIEDLQPRLGASNFYHALLSTALVEFTPETIARIMIHEAAHLADYEPWLRDPAEGRSSIGWYSEALAVSAEDAAARRATGALLKAQASESRWPAGVPRSGIAHSASPTAPTESPFGPPGTAAGAAGPGAYDRGARIVRYAQERLAGTGESLHQRIAARTPPRSSPLAQQAEAWSITAIAQAVGLSTRELLRNSMLADLTNDLVPAEAVQRWGLPQIAAWNHTLPVDRDYGITAGGRLLPRGTPATLAVSVPNGGYAYWYMPAAAVPTGVSLQGSNLMLREHHEVTVTRLR